MIRFLLSLIVVLFFSSLSAEGKPKICLNMIVKNESEVICRCLDTVKPLIDYWVIVDTGSSDGTQEIIKNYLKDIPGELHERPWKNFGVNRNEALELAQGKGDYFLFIDADDWLKYESPTLFSSLTHDCYLIQRGSETYTHLYPHLIKADKPWKWVGALHEYVTCDSPYGTRILEKVRCISGCDGASWKDPEKFLKYVDILKEELKKDPQNERNVFYLAEAYRDSGQKGNALEWYLKRVSMGGWDQEVFWSMLQSACFLNSLGLPWSTVVDNFIQAHRFRPHRIEPIYYLAEGYIREGEYKKAYDWIKSRDVVCMPAQKDNHFNLDWIADYGLLYQLSVCSFYLGHYQEALDACDTLLAKPNLPENFRKQIEINRRFPQLNLAGTDQSHPKPSNLLSIEPVYTCAFNQRKLGNLEEAYQVASRGMKLLDVYERDSATGWIFDYAMAWEFSL